jgi:hypothetical protein
MHLGSLTLSPLSASLHCASSVSSSPGPAPILVYVSVIALNPQAFSLHVCLTHHVFVGGVGTILPIPSTPVSIVFALWLSAAP